MSKVLTDNANYSAIADAIRDKGVEGTWKPSEMAEAIEQIEGGVTPTGEIDITENGTYDVTSYADAVVNVPTGGSIPICDWTETIETVTVGANSVTKCHEIGAYFIGDSTKAVIAFAKSGVDNTYNNVKFVEFDKGATTSPTGYSNVDIACRYRNSWQMLVITSTNWDAILQEGSVWEVHRYD